jgi:ATP-dependent DNA helicase RecQ
LFERLRVWRAAIAKEHGLPAFVVFHDETLRAVAQVRPKSLDELRTISGIGEKKLASYGEGLLTLLSASA